MMPERGDPMPHLIFFFSCACIMVVELVAGRLVASHLGSSLYTWTAVIGVMLAGITAGNVIGGRMADRYEPGRALPWLFLAAAAACVLALTLNAAFAATRPLRGLAWPLQILLSVLAIFLLPASALGTLSPSLAKMAVARGRRLGTTLGGFYASGTAGSIAGTFLTGFWLLFALGNTRVVLVAAAVLLLAGITCRLDARRARNDTLRLARGNPPSRTPAGGRRAPLEGRGCRGPDAHTLLDWRYAPHAIVFFASVCLMIVELLASRVIAEQAGSSLYTWTSVIGVVFAGMSTGNFVGGWLSDRVAPSRFLGWLFLAASLATTLVLVLTHVFETREPLAAWHWPALVFGTVSCIFFLPSVLLGTFGPVATKLAVQRANGVGATIGAVSAWSAAGSIAGTLGAGFWLVPWLGTHTLTMLVACLLAGAATSLGPFRILQAGFAAATAVALFLTAANVPGVREWAYADVFRDTTDYPFSRDSAYQYVRVYDDVSDDEPDRKLRVLSLDHLIHGYVDLKDPSFLNYDYERIYRDVLRRYMGNRTRVSAFFVGGGSYTFPRWLLAEWPGSSAVVAEIDPVVLEANHRALGLPRDTPVATLLMDARNAVDTLPADRRFDFLLGDAFNDLAVPYQLTTLEFTRRVAAHLAPGGAYLVNIIDSYESGLLLGSFVGTLQKVFSHVYVFCTEQDGVAQRRDTFVVAASNVPLDTTGFEPHHGTGFKGSLLTPANLAELRSKCGGRVLTDDDAPVENLIAPVVRQRTGKDR
jgi:spermidine synthase